MNERERSLAIWFLGIAAILCVGGSLVCSLARIQEPYLLTHIGSAALGTMIGILVPTKP